MDGSDQYELQVRQRSPHYTTNNKDDIEHHPSSNYVDHNSSSTLSGNSIMVPTQVEVDSQIRYCYKQLQQYGLVCKDNKKVAAKHLFINMICLFDNKPTSFYILPANHIYLELLELNQNKSQYEGAIFPTIIDIGDHELVPVLPSAIDALVNVLAQDINAMLDRDRVEKGTHGRGRLNESLAKNEFDEIIIEGQEGDEQKKEKNQ
jgi:hypothetical protein